MINSKNIKMNRTMILITAVEHFILESDYYAHGPFVKEINYLGANFEQIIIFAPKIKNQVSRSDLIKHENNILEFIEVPQMGGSSFFEKINVLLKSPIIALKLIKLLISSDNNERIIHLRPPGNIPFISLFVLPFFRKIKKFAKYAGEWDDKNHLDLSYRIQTNLLASKLFFNGIVFVYTRKKCNDNIIPSFAISLTKKQIEKANALSKDKHITNLLIVIFAGRLSHNKGVDILIKSMKEFSKLNNKEFKLYICGDGKEKLYLKKLARKLNIHDCIEWTGWINTTKLHKLYEKAHVICQPTRSQESWGKSVMEGMAYGCIPLCSNIGGLKNQLQETPFLLSEPEDFKSISKKLDLIVKDKDRYEALKKCSVRNKNIKSIEEYNKHIMNEINNYYK